ncbi:hypothetical protein BGW36DRAFT_371028 [Talaromyces proteolyticus]|uniref:Uncharacterized protein n=1 Tax=Talaromyces proteolyticus TaxID=1131652 RepID=A0AAD4L2A6_9EURO|nr:uncharacterized protein BGW36DRAFT_371028 [Talaromyces proteolyticus]KAH8704281.1 hypothetical protein BGW36DRAFT_371028 [Talaromyces proteolyticus]
MLNQQRTTMAAETDWVIRIPRSDEANAFALIYVASAGKEPLDLKLVATEGENPYVVSLKQSRLKDVRSKTFPGNDEELENILASVFKRGLPSSDTRTGASNDSEIELSASIRQSNDEGSQLVIAIRKRIDTITQRVASITLQQDDDQTIELFEWTGLMTTKADSLLRQISTLTHRLQEAEESIKSLNSTISDLVSSKKDHETMLIRNFVQILNEKKFKIRNQQRLLAAAKIDPDKISHLQSAVKQHDVQISRRGKRKAVGRDESSDSDGFELMDVDQAQAVNDERSIDELSDSGETPQPLEEETESEAEAEAEETLSTTSEDRPSLPQGNKTSRSHLAESAEPPPRRDLPFSRKATSKAVVSFKGDDDMDEGATGGETDDDEL